MAIINQASAQRTAADMTSAARQPQDDAGRAVAALAAKQTTYSTYYDYYRGDHPQIYTNKKLADIFRGIDVAFNENWCAVVVDATADRLQMIGAELRTQRAQRAFDLLWRELALDVEADDIHLATLIAGEAYLIAGQFGDDGPDAYFNDPRLCHVFYHPDRPKAKRYAAKWWYDDQTDRIQLTLYYPDRFEYYTAVTAGNQAQANIRFQMHTSAANPYAPTIPVFHFRASRTAQSELTNAIPLQIAINKLVNDLIITAEYGAFKQRFVISQTDVLDQLRNAPNEIWSIPAGDGIGQNTAVGQFDADDLRPYLDSIDHFAAAMATITRTPKHLFFRQAANISGEALITMENPLQRKVRKLTDRLTPEWRAALTFLLQLAGQRVNPSDIRPVFESASTIQPLTLAQTRSTNRTAGIPIVTQLRREGWSDAELAQLAADAEAEAGAFVIPDAA